MKNLTLLLSSGTILASLSGAARADVNTLRVGYLANIVMGQPLLGIEKGEYAKLVKGVKFEGKHYPAGPEVLEALRAGVVDIAATGPYPPLKAFVKAKDIVLLGGLAKGGTELLVKNPSIRTVADLKGKIIGVNQAGSTVDAQVRFQLLQAGLAPDRDVRIIEVEPAQQADALARGEVAAVAAPAPWPSVVKTKGARALVSWKRIQDGGNYYSAVYYTTKKFAQENPTLIKRFVNANRALTKRIAKNRAASDAQILATWSKISRKTLAPGVAKAAFATIKWHDKPTTKDFLRIQDIAYKVGQVKTKDDLKGFLYTR